MAADHAGNVQQVLDDLRLLPGVALDDVQGMGNLLGIDDPLAQHLSPAQNRRQRRPQFVGQDGEKFILGPAGGLGFGAGVLFTAKQLGPLAEVLGQSRSHVVEASRQDADLVIAGDGCGKGGAALPGGDTPGGGGQFAQRADNAAGDPQRRRNRQQHRRQCDKQAHAHRRVRRRGRFSLVLFYKQQRLNLRQPPVNAQHPNASEIRVPDRSAAVGRQRLLHVGGVNASPARRQVRRPQAGQQNVVLVDQVIFPGLPQAGVLGHDFVEPFQRGIAAEYPAGSSFRTANRLAEQDQPGAVFRTGQFHRRDHIGVRRLQPLRELRQIRLLCFKDRTRGPENAALGVGQKHPIKAADVLAELAGGPGQSGGSLLVLRALRRRLQQHGDGPADLYVGQHRGQFALPGRYPVSDFGFFQ